MKSDITPSISNIDEYIATHTSTTQTMLQTLRNAIQKAAPNAIEVISYGMPAFKDSDRMLVYFAGYKNHIGLYPTGSGIAHFKDELQDYKTSKGTVQFPLNAPLPLALIERMVKFRVEENKQKALEKKVKK